MTDVLARPDAVRIPEPPGNLPLVGHALQIPTGVDGLFWLMARSAELGPLYRLRVFGRQLLLAGGADVVADLADTTRFRKHVHDDLVAVRGLAGDGLFTAYEDEPNWRKAHDILMPAFSLTAMRGYHATMVDVARSLVASWDAAAGRRAVDVPGDMTRLTFDTIGLCGFGYDFRSFDSPDRHPFVVALARALGHAQRKGESVPGTDKLRFRQNAQFRTDVASMEELVGEVIARRRAMSGGSGGQDLLGRMLTVPDPVTGTVLDDDNIRNQAITFLIAGHETTSGALSFALHHLVEHPAVLARAQAEVDALWGADDEVEPDYADVGRLRYVRQVLDESLRLWPTAPAFAVEALADTTVGDAGYPVRKGESVMVLTPQLHRDPAWGEDVELFDPDRFSPEREAARPAHLFKPFGTGERACIGRQFALHEAVLVLAMLVHRYRFVDHRDHELSVGMTLTIKPEDFTLELVRRTPAERVRGEAAVPAAVGPVRSAGAARVVPGTALRVLHGSNLGTCAQLAGDLAAEAEGYGCAPSVGALDSAVDALDPAAGPLVVVAASYNGRPTDDAAAFLAWVQELTPGSLAGLRYAVLGVGDRNWAATYQRVPTQLDEALAAAGGEALLPRGAADASGDLVGTVDRWGADLRAALLATYGDPSSSAATDDGTAAPVADGPLYRVEPAPGRATGVLHERFGLQPMTVVAAHELVDTTHELGRSKRFLRLRLPDGVGYRTGDHLALLPTNPAELVERVTRRFDLDPGAVVRVSAARPARQVLPVDRPLAVGELLGSFVELQSAATPAQVARLAELTGCPPERHALAELAAGEPGTHSVLDLLERFRSCPLTFAEFLEMLPTLQPRHYSISSSALADPGHADLMVSLLVAPHRGGGGQFRGIASHHVQGVRAGDVVMARVLPCRESFRVPADRDVPVVLVSAGTGLAPFRGALLDRAVRGPGAPMISYVGCDHPDVDQLHRDELEDAARRGGSSVRPAFMHAPRDGHRFVQDRIAADAAELWPLLEAGAVVRVCGDGRRMAPAVREAFRELHAAATGASAAQSQAWLDGLVAQDRYVEDVWLG